MSVYTMSSLVQSKTNKTFTYLSSDTCYGIQYHRQRIHYHKHFWILCSTFIEM